MIEPTRTFKDMSPSTKARIIGVLYLATIVTGLIAQGYIGGSIITGDAATTATNIVAHESLYRLGFTIYMIEMACQVAMMCIFYDLLRPVNKSIAFLSVSFGLVGCAIKTLSRAFYFAPLFLLGGTSHYVGTFNTQQLQSIANLLISINDQGAAIALIFFGISSLLKGWLVFKSTFLPRFLGVITVIGGAGWVLFMSPALGARAFPVIGGLGLLASLINIGWFLIKGVDDDRWLEKAAQAKASIWN